jgi:hypothetical protein
VLAAAALSSVTARAESGNSAVAQALFDQAKQLIAAGHVAEACPKLEESQRLDPRSGTLLNLANCYERTSHLASAWSTFIEASTSAKADGKADRETVARQRAAALAPRLSKLTITVAPELKRLPGLAVLRDGVVVREPEWGLPLPSDSGQHEVTANAPGRVPFRARVDVAGEGVTTTVNVPNLAEEGRKKAAPPSPEQAPSESPIPSPSAGLGATRAVALVAGGLGLLGVGLGSAFGVASKSKHDQATAYCNGTACTDPLGVTYGDAAKKDGNIATALLIVGGVGLAAGVTLWFAAPRSAESHSPQVGFGLGTLRVKGSF